MYVHLPLPECLIAEQTQTSEYIPSLRIIHEN